MTEPHNLSDGKMSKSERDELGKLARRREKLAKADVDALVADRLAEFERNLATIYRPADDPVWAEAKAGADQAVATANAAINERCDELGIPPEFRPRVNVGWYGRGESAAAERRAELRKVAATRLSAEAKIAKATIERASLEVQTQLVSAGLESERAHQFLSSMPSAVALMPAVPSVVEIEAVAGLRG